MVCNVCAGIKLYYSDGTDKREGDKNGEEHEFRLDDDEKIVKVIPKTGYMIDNLEFHTNKGKVYGPYGGSGGGLNDDDVPPEGRDGFLSGIRGDIVDVEGSLGITGLVFKWAVF